MPHSHATRIAISATPEAPRSDRAARAARPAARVRVPFRAVRKLLRAPAAARYDGHHLWRGAAAEPVYRDIHRYLDRGTDLRAARLTADTQALAAGRVLVLVVERAGVSGVVSQVAGQPRGRRRVLRVVQRHEPVHGLVVLASAAGSALLSHSPTP